LDNNAVGTLFTDATGGAALDLDATTSGFLAFTLPVGLTTLTGVAFATLTTPLEIGLSFFS
jgi:hypothetical protein